MANAEVNKEELETHLGKVETDVKGMLKEKIGLTKPEHVFPSGILTEQLESIQDDEITVVPPGFSIKRDERTEIADKLVFSKKEKTGIWLTDSKERNVIIDGNAHGGTYDKLGLVAITGDYGSTVHYLGGAISGGKVFVGRDAKWIGQDLGGDGKETMSKGEIYVGGNVDSAGRNMVGGRIIIGGNVENYAGWCMKGGLVACRGNINNIGCQNTSKTDMLGGLLIAREIHGKEYGMFFRDETKDMSFAGTVITSRPGGIKDIIYNGDFDELFEYVVTELSDADLEAFSVFRMEKDELMDLEDFKDELKKITSDYSELKENAGSDIVEKYRRLGVIVRYHEHVPFLKNKDKKEVLESIADMDFRTFGIFGIDDDILENVDNFKKELVKMKDFYNELRDTDERIVEKYKKIKDSSVADERISALSNDAKKEILNFVANEKVGEEVFDIFTLCVNSFELYDLNDVAELKEEVDKIYTYYDALLKIDHNIYETYKGKLSKYDEIKSQDTESKFRIIKEFVRGNITEEQLEPLSVFRVESDDTDALRAELSVLKEKYDELQRISNKNDNRSFGESKYLNFRQFTNKERYEFLRKYTKEFTAATRERVKRYLGKNNDIRDVLDEFTSSEVYSLLKHVSKGYLFHERTVAGALKELRQREGEIPADVKQMLGDALDAEAEQGLRHLYGLKKDLKIKTIQSLKKWQADRREVNYEKVKQQLEKEVRDKSRAYLLDEAALYGENFIMDYWENITGTRRDVSENELNALYIHKRFSKNRAALEKLLNIVENVNQEFPAEEREKHCLTAIQSLPENERWIEKNKDKFNMSLWLSRDFSKEYAPEVSLDFSRNIEKIKEDQLYNIQRYLDSMNIVVEKSGDELIEELENNDGLKDAIKTGDSEVFRTIYKNHIPAYKGADNQKTGIVRKIRFYVEKDLLSVLQMGNYFNDSCLNTFKENGWATTLNAADANKQVVYGVDEKGNIISRNLLVITKDDRLGVERTYRNVSSIDVNKYAMDFVRAYKDALGIEFAASGKPELLVAEEPYSNGLVDANRPFLSEAHTGYTKSPACALT